jgi:UDP-N-acetyl-2-amino-2-deoxyglucuronate dehydrogenase
LSPAFLQGFLFAYIWLMYQFAIVGCGNAAHYHARTIIKAGILAAVYDIDPEKARSFADLYGGKPYVSLEDLLLAEKEVITIVVCSPTGLHAEHCIKSLQAGKHVLCERPLCITNAAAWQIVETARLCRRNLWIVSLTKEQAFLQQISDHLTEKARGNAIGFNLVCRNAYPDDLNESWKTMSFPGGNSLLVHFTDYIEAVLRLFGKIEQCHTILSSAGKTGNFEIGGATTMRTENKMIGSVTWILVEQLAQPEARLEVFFEKATIQQTGNDAPEMASMSRLTGQDENILPNYEKIYQDILKQLNAGKVETTSIPDFAVIEAIEKIYSSVTCQTQELP